MHRTICGLAALVCLLGGSALLTPATGQGRYLSCDLYLQSRCADSAVEVCVMDEKLYWAECKNGTTYTYPL
ncbi:MAG TPA: hypothetical protein VF615_05780 [Longimicrobiaceae bacterium]|jgi:hypothetical protein